MRTKQTRWYDTEKDKVFYGVMVYYNGAWIDYAEGRKAFLVQTEEECEQKRKELRRLDLPANLAILYAEAEEQMCHTTIVR